MSWDEPRVCLLFPHLALGGGETAMIAVAEGLSEQLPLSVAVLERRASAAVPALREVLAKRLPEAVSPASWVSTPEELARRFAAADVVLWYGTNSFTPEVLAGMPRRPASLRVVHTEKPEEGIGFHRRWQGVIDATFGDRGKVDLRVVLVAAPTEHAGMRRRSIEALTQPRHSCRDQLHLRS